MINKLQARLTIWLKLLIEPINNFKLFMLPLVQGRMQENFAIWSVVRGQLSVAKKQKTED